MNLIRQTEPGLCLAACVAMVANASLDDVLANARILKSQDGVRFLPDNEAIKFLASRMLAYGIRGFKPGERVTDGSSHEFTISLNIREAPAILTVPSKRFMGFTHAVVWDNETRKVFDPLMDEPQNVGDYEIIEWSPVSHI